MINTAPLTLDIFTDVDKIEIKALIFQSPFNAKHGYVWRDKCKPDGIADYDYRESMRTKYELDDTATLHNFNAGSSVFNRKYWLIYLEDCHCPLLHVIGGDDNLSEVLDDAIDSFETLQWSHDDIKEYYPTEAEYNKAIDDGVIGIADGGLNYQNELIKMYEIKLIGIELYR